MDKEMDLKPLLEKDVKDSFDSASPVEMVEAIDLAMRRYFGADDWLAIRNKWLPGLQREVEAS